ncbi:Uncharacterised protein [Bordetella pertussis]|nr:Uncharacterised protein [Bordetella pertussis]CFP62741.1 Uncharacterised protein [Bordetella pertussis]CFW33559.1 Uncharacterised protein [Bordetella pertussis]
MPSARGRSGDRYRYEDGLATTYCSVRPSRRRVSSRLLSTA